MQISQEELKVMLDKHLKWLNGIDGGERADLSNADLRYADLSNANLSNADLSNADLDFSSLPLWCGSLSMNVDKRIAAQIAYHFCRLKCEDAEVKAAQEAIKTFANQFHRANECGRLE